MSYTIGLAEPNEIESLLSLLEELFALEADFQFNPERARRGLGQLIHGETNGAVLVARYSGEVIGMCSAQLVISTAEGAASAWVEDVIVTQRMRGRGVGRALLGALANWCDENGATRMQLMADRENLPALDFYRHTGWQPTQLVAWRKSVGV